MVAVAVVAGAPGEARHRDSSSTYALDVLGFDLSTNRRKTALVRISLDGGRPRIAEARRGLPPEEVAAILGEPTYAMAAIDVPFGWPTHFVDFLSSGGARGLSRSPAHADGFRDKQWRTDYLGQRRTDRVLRERVAETFDEGRAKRIRPLSVSFDKLGATAAMWAWIEAQLPQDGRFSRSGEYPTESACQIFETYPSAQLVAWGRQGNGKPDWSGLQQLLNLDAAVLANDDRVALESSDDVRDALVCACTALARLDGVPMIAPSAEDRKEATDEGWIWVSTEPPHF